MKKRWAMAAALALLLSVPVFAQECDSHEFEPYLEEPSCTEAGYQCQKCKVCGFSQEYQNIGELGHDPGQWELVRPSACGEPGLEESVCRRCGETKEREIPALDHSFTESQVLPTCKADGYTLLVCSLCDHREKRDIVSALGHAYESTVTDPTCTATGYTRHVCSRCQDSYRTDVTEKLGHCYGEGVETKEPTLTTMGRLTYSCQRCGDTYTETTPKWTNPFLDLDKKAYYYTGVLWASNNGITSGTAPQSFSPEDSCTRGQVVTFLWRMAGKPLSVSANAEFRDVPKDAYYHDAVQWAVDQGITKGVGENRFDPDRICTRAEVVTFLHRFMDKPAPMETDGFLDVCADDYFFESVYWAYEQGITQGTAPNAFSPTQTCTRGQIVTFLYRAKNLMQS